MRKAFYISLCSFSVSFGSAQIHDSVRVPNVSIDTLTDKDNYTIYNTTQSHKDYPLKKDSSEIVNRKFRSDFKDDYDSSDFDYTYKKQKERSIWDKIKEWLARMLNIDVRPSSQMSQVFEFCFKVLGALALIVAIGFIIKLIVDKKFENIFGKKAKKNNVEIYDIEQNIHEIDFETLIQNTIVQGSYRLATRYYFLWLLKNLSQAEIIEWNIEKTNAQYLNEIENVDIKTNFQYLIYIYDNVWYGEFEIDQKDFGRIEQSFDAILKKFQKNER